MRFVDLILSNKLDEAKDILRSRLSEIVSKRLQEAKRYVAEDMLEEVELDEAKRNTNIIKMGRINKIRKREEMPKAKLLYRRMYESLALKDIEFQVIL